MPRMPSRKRTPSRLAFVRISSSSRRPADAVVVEPRAGDVHRQVLEAEAAAVDLAQQRRQRGRDDVGDVRGDGLARRPVARARGARGRARRHRALGEHRVATVLAGERAHLGAGVVDDLAAQVAAEVRAGRRDRDRRSGVRRRRERGDVGGLHDHEAGARRAGALGPDVDHDGDRRRELGVHDLLHRVREPARRVEPEHERRRVLALGRVQLRDDPVGRHRVDLGRERRDPHHRRW